MWVAATWFQTPPGWVTSTRRVGDILGGWDGVWYQRVAHAGLPGAAAGRPRHGAADLQRVGVLPGASRCWSAVLMLTGLPFEVAGGRAQPGAGSSLHAPGVALLQLRAARLAAAGAGPARARGRGPAGASTRRRGSCSCPTPRRSPCLLVAGSLLLLMQRRYLAVAAVALALGFTRAVAPALGCAAVAHLVLRWREDRAAGTRPLRRRARARRR